MLSNYVHYDGSLNAGADVFFSTVGSVALESAITPVVRILNENYEPLHEVSVMREQQEEHVFQT